MNLNKNGKVFTSKSVGTGPSSYKKRIYRAAVSQRLGGDRVVCRYRWNWSVDIAFASKPAYHTVTYIQRHISDVIMIQ